MRAKSSKPLNQTRSLPNSMNALRVLLTLSVVAMYVVLGALVCWLAGTWHLPGIWAVFVVQGIAGIIGLWTLDEELIKERLRPRGKDQDPFAPLILSILLLAMLAIAALDLGRWHISDNVPHIVGFIAIIAQALGWAGFFWAMKVNQFSRLRFGCNRTGSSMPSAKDRTHSFAIRATLLALWHSSPRARRWAPGLPPYPVWQSLLI